jgi:hypothetical protein
MDLSEHISFPAAHDHGMGEVVAASLLALVGVFDVIGAFRFWLFNRSR